MKDKAHMLKHYRLRCFALLLCVSACDPDNGSEKHQSKADIPVAGSSSQKPASSVDSKRSASASSQPEEIGGGAMDLATATAALAEQSTITYWALAARPSGIGHAYAVDQSPEKSEARALEKCNAASSTNPETLNPDCVSLGVFNNRAESCVALHHGHVPLTRYTAHHAISTSTQHARREATRSALSQCRKYFGRRSPEACIEGTSESGPATQTSFLYCTSEILDLAEPFEADDSDDNKTRNSTSARFWAFAARKSGIGHAFALGATADEAFKEALFQCNSRTSMTINASTDVCNTVAAYSLDRQECVTAVHGFVPLTNYTAHFGRSLDDRDPRATADAKAFGSCKAHWESYADTACRSYNGGAGNAVRTHFSFCTSDVIVALAPHLPTPEVSAKYLNDSGELLREEDYDDQSPIAREIRRVNQNASLNAIERMKRILAIKKRYGN